MNVRDTAAREVSFADLVERQSRFVFCVAYAIARNVEDAEDVVQETFLKLYRAGSWESLNDERAFLARVAWRTAVDRFPKRKQQVPVPEFASSGISPETQAIAADLQETVHRLIDVLPEDLRQTLALSTVDELSSLEIARIMNIKEGTVRTRLMRAREILKAKLRRIEKGTPCGKTN